MLAMPRIMMEPINELAIPPPASPTGLGVCVRKDQPREPAPLSTRQAKIATNAQTTITDKPAAKPVKKRSVSWQRRLICPLGIGPRWRTSCDRPDQQPRENIHNDGEQK